MKNEKKTIEQVNKIIYQQSTRDNFAGYDPFDGLNSKVLAIAPWFKRGIFGLLWIQLFKLSPINLRRIFLVPKRRNPKGIGLFILGLLEEYQHTQDHSYLTQATELGDWLLQQQSDREQWHHSCWGYHFDWKARAFFVPKGKPNIITTVYVSRALYELGRVTGKSKYTIPALDSSHFITKTLYTITDEEKFFAYIPGEKAFVHNANLWGAAWVAFTAKITNNLAHRNLALAAARCSVAAQSTDGSWVYGTLPHHQFIDGFHSGYNLEALCLLSEALGSEEFDTNISEGLKYYRDNFFEADGSVKYYHNNRYPLDTHSVAQAVLTLIKVGGTVKDLELAKQVIQQSIDTLFLNKRNHFAYQKNKYFTNKNNYIRWTQAWAYYSLSYFIRKEHEENIHETV